MAFKKMDPNIGFADLEIASIMSPYRLAFMEQIYSFEQL